MAVLAAVLALVAIIIMSIIILVAVWRKVRSEDLLLFCRATVFESRELHEFMLFLSETSLRDQVEGDRVREPGRPRVHLRGPHPPSL